MHCRYRAAGRRAHSCRRPRTFPNSAGAARAQHRLSHATIVAVPALVSRTKYSLRRISGRAARLMASRNQRPLRLGCDLARARHEHLRGPSATGRTRSHARPPLVLLDEPFAGLDRIVTRDLIGALDAWQRAHRVATIIVDHQENVLRKLCDRVYVLERGRIIQEGSWYDLESKPASRSLAQLLTPL